MYAYNSFILHSRVLNYISHFLKIQHGRNILPHSSFTIQSIFAKRKKEKKCHTRAACEWSASRRLADVRGIQPDISDRRKSWSQTEMLNYIRLHFRQKHPTDKIPCRFRATQNTWKPARWFPIWVVIIFLGTEKSRLLEALPVLWSVILFIFFNARTAVNSEMFPRRVSYAASASSGPWSREAIRSSNLSPTKSLPPIGEARQRIRPCALPLKCAAEAPACCTACLCVNPQNWRSVITWAPKPPKEWYV